VATAASPCAGIAVVSITSRTSNQTGTFILTMIP
jgi:hypothetical protein